MMNNQLKTKLLNVELIFNKTKIKESDKVADLGCGKFGYFTFALSDMVGKNGKVYAVDVRKENLEMIDKEIKKNSIENIQTVWSDIEVANGTKIPSDSLNTVFLVNTLHESEKTLEILQEAKRLVIKNGYIAIIDWKKTASSLGPDTSRRIDKDFLIQASKDIGLYLEEEFEAGTNHFGLIFSRP